MKLNNQHNRRRRLDTPRDFSEPGKDAFHRVPHFSEEAWDAVERVPTKTRTDDGAHGVTRPTGVGRFVVLLLVCAQVAYAGSQWIICPPGQALVKVPNQARLLQDGTFQLEFACVPAPTNAVLADTTETFIPALNLYISLLPDDIFGFGGESISTVPCSIEHVLTNGTPTTQLACDPSYMGGLMDPTNLASVEPPDPPPGTNINNRTRAATSIEQAALACLSQSTVFTSTQFLNSLGVSDQVKQWYDQGYRAGITARTNPPLIQFLETSVPSFLAVIQSQNTVVESFLTGAEWPNTSHETLSPGYDCGVLLGDYAGLVASWPIACTQGFPNVAISSWTINSLPELNNGLSAWVAYLHDGNPEVYKYASYAIRQVGQRACSTYNYPDCLKGNNLRNVMMHDESNTSRDGVYPPYFPSNLTTYDGPVEADFAGLYFSAIFYDISKDVGLGDAKANLLFWKTISVITNCSSFTMRNFAGYVLTAANALWPDTNHPGLSLYDAQLKDVLRSRGIAIGSEITFRDNLPPAIGPVVIPSSNQFGSSHPDSQPNANSYGAFNYFLNGYVQAGATTNDYMVYQFYKYSTYGPCDDLFITDGTFTNTGTGFLYNNDGSYYHGLEDRKMRNLLLMVPGPGINWSRYRARCPDEHTGFYAEDLRPFGFRVIKAVKNGFAWKTTRLATNDSVVTYQFDIVDPSQTTLGAAAYTFTFTDPSGAQTNLNGASVQYAANQNEPLDILVTRVRGGVTNTIAMSEPGSNLDATDRPHYLVGLKTADSSLNDSDRSHYFNLIPMAAQLTTYNVATNRSFNLQFTGTSGAAYQVWASTNLFDWQQLGTATEITSGRISLWTTRRRIYNNVFIG